MTSTRSMTDTTADALMTGARVDARGAAEARQLVAHVGPVGARVEEDVQRGRAVDRAVEAREHDVHLVGVARRLAEQRAAAAAAERARAVLGGAVAHQRLGAGLEREPLARDAEPGDERGAVIAPAHAAMAVAAEKRG